MSVKFGRCALAWLPLALLLGAGGTAAGAEHTASASTGVLLGGVEESSAAIESIDPLDIVGEAFDASTGELLYRELHDCNADGTLCSVDYRDSSGQVIAFKELDYSDSLYGPGLVMRDLRGGTEHVLPGGDGQEIVVDAGFDNFVRSRWEELSRGETVTFPFQVVGFDRPFDMKARMGGSQECDATSLCLKVEIDSWLLGLVADPIELAYSRESRRLLRFVGVSNLRDEQGRTPKVDIRYSYDDLDTITQ